MIQKLLSRLRYLKKTSPKEGYNLWASHYDEQSDNAIVFLNNIILNELLSQASIENKIVVDVGCGTGAHWEKIVSFQPVDLIGYDVSDGMLKKLHKKFPNAKTFLIEDNRLNQLGDDSCDVIVSSLVLGHIKNLKKTLQEWDRVLKKNGEIVLTDFHPAEIERGGRIRFKSNGESFIIKNYLHSLTAINEFARLLNWQVISFKEAKVDERIKHFYEAISSLHLYRNMYGAPVVYGLHFKKKTV